VKYLQQQAITELGGVRKCPHCGDETTEWFELRDHRTNTVYDVGCADCLAVKV